MFGQRLHGRIACATFLWNEYFYDVGGAFGYYVERRWRTTFYKFADHCGVMLLDLGLILAPKVKILNDKLSERLSLVKQNHKTLSILCGKLDAVYLTWSKIKSKI